MKMPGQAAPVGRVWSEQQQAIFKAFREPAGHVLVRARAGCAKTTTSLEGVKQAPERRILVAAFNKLIADEAQTPYRDNLWLRCTISVANRKGK